MLDCLASHNILTAAVCHMSLQVSLLQEPVAAAMAFGFGKRYDAELLLVFDLGGGTFDLSLVDSFEGIMEVRPATACQDSRRNPCSQPPLPGHCCDSSDCRFQLVHLSVTDRLRSRHGQLSALRIIIACLGTRHICKPSV
jgi:hypothetical protein